MSRESLMRALKILHRAKNEKKTLTELARDDGNPMAGYQQLLARHNLTARYAEHTKNLSKDKNNAVLQKQIDNLTRVKVSKAAFTSKIRARQLLNRCIELKVSISGLASLDGFTASNYISILERGGFYEKYMELYPHTNTRQDPEIAARGHALFARCKEQEVSYGKLAALEGGDGARYYDYLIRAKIKKEYDKWRIDLKVARLKSKMQEGN